MTKDRFTPNTARPVSKSGAARPRGPQTSAAAIERALRETLMEQGVSGDPLHQPYVHPRYSMLLHVAWTNSDALNGTKLLWQWEREKRLYNLVTSLHGSRFMVDNNESRMIVDKDSKFVEQVVNLEFIDLATKVKPSEFIARDPFSYLAEFGADIAPYEDPAIHIAEARAELRSHKTKPAAKPATKTVQKANKPKAFDDIT